MKVTFKGDNPLSRGIINLLQMAGNYVTQEMNNITHTDALFYFDSLNAPTKKDTKESLIEKNATKVIELFNEFADRGCRQFIYASSSTIYGHSIPPYDEDCTPVNPLTPYDHSIIELDNKTMEFAQKRNVNVVGLRYSIIYGPEEQGSIYKIIRKIAVSENPQITWDGNQKVDWLYINDAANAAFLALQYNKGGIILNIGPGNAWSLREIITVLNKHAHVNLKPKFMPIQNGDHYLERSHMESKITKAKNSIGFIPQYDVKTGIITFFQMWK